jgi:HlyD family secretion protein
MSSASTPSAAHNQAPQLLPPPPATVRPAPRKPRRGVLWAAVSIALLAGSLWQWRARSLARESARAAAAVTRTAPVALADLRQTIRVSGTIQAERFAMLIAPQIRGSRSGRGRLYTGTPAATLPAATASNATAAAASTTSSLGATRGTTNRFSDMSGSSTAGSGVPDRATTSTSLTESQSLGSTSGSLMDPSRYSNDNSADFSLILLKCAAPGGRVKAGDPVAEFDRQYQLLRLDDYKASRVQQDAGIAKLKADLAVSRQAHDQLVKSAMGDWAKANVDLQTIPVRSAIEAEEFKLTEQEMAAAYKEIRSEQKNFDESQRASLRYAELDRDQAAIEFGRATANVEKMVLKAPIDGIAVMQTIWRGGDYGQVQPGDQVYSGQSIMTIVDPSSMVLNAEVNQVDSESLRVGMKATVHLDAYPDLGLDATVIAVGAMTSAGGWRANWVREVPIRVKILQQDARVIPDLSGSADIELAAEKQAAVAPLASVFRDGEGKPYVFVASSGAFEKREVELGLASNVAVAVRSGLRPGETVAVMRPVAARK